LVNFAAEARRHARDFQAATFTSNKVTRRRAPMTEKPRHIPEGYGTLTPYIIVDGAARAIAFYERAFAAREVMRLDGPNGRIGHAELEIGESKIMLADQFPDFGAHAPGHYGGSPVSLHLYVADADATVARAVAADATIVRAVEDQFYGDRLGTIKDPFGHIWHISTRKETLTADELRRRAAERARQSRRD
jgi:PhnB protein